MHLWDFSRAVQYDQLEPRLAVARRAIQSNPDDPAALAILGEWYAFRGMWDWGAELLERARAAGGEVPAVTLARCYWQTGDVAKARREFERAMERKEAPDLYLNLCIEALADSAR